MSGIRALPVLMFHSVAPPGALAPHGWLERLSEPVALFEAMLEDWRRRGVHTVGTDEIRRFLAGEIALPRRSVALTFDDGYLDNWVAVTPLLKRYGQKAIVFVSTDFIDPRPSLRPTIEEAGLGLSWQGYLSAPEMRAMVDSGAVEIQSHARTHTWHFVSPKIVDFYGPHWNIEHPKCRYRFLWLNRHVPLKPFALEHLRRDAVPWGTPIYEFAPALRARVYRPDIDLEAILVEKVDREGGERFFERSAWRQELDGLVEEHRRRFGERGVLETENERRERVASELRESRMRLESATGRPVTFLSPPQGGADDETLTLARACGYSLVTAPSEGRVLMNQQGSGAAWVHRAGTGFDLFGRGRGTSASLLSQRIVLARYSGGAPAASAITRAAGAASQLAAKLGLSDRNGAAGAAQPQSANLARNRRSTP